MPESIDETLEIRQNIYLANCTEMQPSIEIILQKFPVKFIRIVEWRSLFVASDLNAIRDVKQRNPQNARFSEPFGRLNAF